MTAFQRVSLFLFAVVLICNGIFVLLAVLMVLIAGAAAESDSVILLMGWMALLAVAGIAVCAGMLAPDESPAVIQTAYVAASFLMGSACTGWYNHFNISGTTLPPIDVIVVGTLAIANLMTLTLNRPLRLPSVAKS